MKPSFIRRARPGTLFNTGRGPLKHQKGEESEPSESCQFPQYGEYQEGVLLS